MPSPFTPPRVAREALGRRIRKVRKEIRGISLDELGTRVGTSRQHLIRLEKGDHWPSDKLIAKIADALDTPVSYFVGGEVADEHRERIADALGTLADELLAIARETANGAHPAASEENRRAVA